MMELTIFPYLALWLDCRYVYIYYQYYYNLRYFNHNIYLYIYIFSYINIIFINLYIICFKDSGAFLEKRFAGLATMEIHCNGMELYNFTNNYTSGYQVRL